MPPDPEVLSGHAAGAWDNHESQEQIATAGRQAECVPTRGATHAGLTLGAAPRRIQERRGADARRQGDSQAGCGPLCLSLARWRAAIQALPPRVELV